MILNLEIKVGKMFGMMIIGQRTIIFGCMVEGRKKKTSIGYPPGMNYIVNEFNKLVTMGWIICKPNTLYLKDLVNQIEEKLDYHINNLIKYPAKLPGGYYSDKPFDLVPEKSYPIRWLEILGELFHPLMLKYNEHIKFGLPDALKTKRYK